MKKVLKTFQTFMEEALKKSLPELDLKLAAPPDASQKIMQARLCFEGKNMRAQAFLSCTDEFLQMTCPLPRGEENHSVDTVIDWLGELGNLILGRLKNRLLAHDMTIKISAPDFAGNWQRPKNAETVNVWFECEGALIGFDVVLEGQVPQIGEAIQQSAEILPGDAIYRLNDTSVSGENVDLVSKIRAGVEDSSPVPEEKEERMERKETVEKKSFSMHFHNAKDKEIVKKSSSTLTIASVSWTALNSLNLKFSNGLEASVCPMSLVEMGMGSLEIEGFTLHFHCENDVARVSIPKLALALSLSSK